MTDMLMHTLVWTGVLIALVLVLRRPVTRSLGAEAAYMLWALPLLRLVLPPITLPAWMAPPAEVAAPMGEVVIDQTELGDLTTVAAAPVPAPPEAGFDLMALLAGLPWVEVALLAWLGGAGVFLWRRFGAYFALRAELLAAGREVGRAPGLLGKVRLIETPATTAPLAMGVLDPVIALPPGFMALHDRGARDLALAHELAHHRGGDLLVNVLVQPLFALHWWNPLGRYGWMALRRDQEAACDARVMARRDAAERVAYAKLIARFATAPNLAHHAALTAPMACPVLGEKSIIHRLRSLSMSELSPRRRMAGRALLGAGLLALPLTASISYAAADTFAEIPAPPEPPAPPAAPDAPTPPQPPEAPDAPEPPQPPEPPMVVLIERDGAKIAGNTEVTEHVWKDKDGKERRMRMEFRSAPDAMVLSRRLEGAHGADAADRTDMLASLREALAEAERVRADMPRILEESLAASEAARAAALQRVIVKRDCKPGSNEVSETSTGKDGTQVVTICTSRAMASARRGLEDARAEIARDKDIPEKTRKQLLEQLDRQIARWRDREG
jgi:beta-lactamase regulating signal transducer with metallopeptidase domain